MHINNAYMNQRIIDIATCVNWPAKYRMGDTNARIF